MVRMGQSVVVAAVVLMAVACSGSEDAEPGTETTAEATTATTEPRSPDTSPASTTEATSDSTTTLAAEDERGTRDAPLPAGETVRVGEWDVTVLSAIPDATEAVLAENEFNDPPADDRQFFVVEVSATYEGAESEEVFTGLTMSTVGDSAVAYNSFEDTCGVVPGELDTFSEVFPGGTQVGNLCWHVLTDDVESLVLIVDNAFSFDEDRAYLALR